MMDARAALILYASRHLGRLYIWGGESSGEGGFDCSGFASHCLAQVARSWPRLYDGRRRTSAGLYRYYLNRGAVPHSDLAELKPGSLAFYRNGPQSAIYHVAIHAASLPALDGELEFGPVAIESGGGSAAHRSPRASLQKPAGVRLSATDAHGRAQWVALDPFAVMEVDR